MQCGASKLPESSRFGVVYANGGAASKTSPAPQCSFMEYLPWTAFTASWLVWFVDVLWSTEPEKAPAVRMLTECGVCGLYFSYALSGYVQTTTANIFFQLKQNKKICHRELGTSSVCTYCDM